MPKHDNGFERKLEPYVVISEYLIYVPEWDGRTPPNKNNNNKNKNNALSINTINIYITPPLHGYLATLTYRRINRYMSTTDVPIGITTSST